MSEFFEYPFRIVGPKPETISMARLATYMGELARLLGSQESVHFSRIEDRSVAIVAYAPIEDLPLISPRVRSASRGDADAEAASPWKKINEYLAEDGWTAEMPLPRSGEVITFPGKSRSAKILRSVSQPTSIQGRVVRIEGGGDIVRVGLDIDGDLTARISIDAQNAQRLANHFHRNVRLSGEGRWKRDGGGKWTLEHLSATSFVLLEDTPLDEALDRLRSVIKPGSGAAIMKAVDELRSA